MIEKVLMFLLKILLVQNIQRFIRNENKIFGKFLCERM